MFSFSLSLLKELKIPIGYFTGAVASSPSGRWLSHDMIKEDEACTNLLLEKGITNVEQWINKYNSDFVKFQIAEKKSRIDGSRRPKRIGCALGKHFEAKIRSFIPYAIRGVLWDQGEALTGVKEIDQYTMMGALIKGWRKEWAQGDFPFLYMQKPSGRGCAWDKENPITRMAEDFMTEPTEIIAKRETNGAIRYLHTKIMQYVNTAFITTSDLGAKTNHPLNKSGYGHRACNTALGFVYNQDRGIYGPLYDSHEIIDNAVYVKFLHIGEGLTYKHGDKLQGFEIAGKDNVWHWATAEIENNMVKVVCDKVSNPKKARYAWGKFHQWANLFNKNKMPTLTFITE